MYYSVLDAPQTAREPWLDGRAELQRWGWEWIGSSCREMRASRLRCPIVAPRRDSKTALRRVKHLIRDTFLGMGLGENLGVVARL